jgi:hypothetical protein
VKNVTGGDMGIGVVDEDGRRKEIKVIGAKYK